MVEQRHLYPPSTIPKLVDGARIRTHPPRGAGSQDEVLRKLAEHGTQVLDVQGMAVAPPPSRDHPLGKDEHATTDEVKEYLHLRYPNAKPVTLDPIYEENDDAYWTALKGNLFLKNPAIFDTAALEAHRPPKSVGITHSVPH